MKEPGGRRSDASGSGHRLHAWVEGFALAAFLIGYVCPYLPPEQFWWTGIAAIGLPFSALLLVLLSIPVLLRKRIRPAFVAVHAAALLLICIRFIHLDAPPADSGPKPRDLVLMTQNLPSAPIDRARKSSFKLLEVVRRVNPHLIGIQEGIVMDVDSGRYRSTKEEKFRVLLDSLDYDAKPVPIESSGMMPAWHDPVLSRIPVENQRQIEIEYPAGPLEEPLRLVRTELTWQGRKLIHYNIHLATYGTSKPWRSIRGRPPFSPATVLNYLKQMRAGFIRRAWEARTIKELIGGEASPLLISGDFNCTPNNWAYRHLSLGLQDSWLEAGSGWGATYYSALPIWRIDYVLSSAALTPASAEVRPIPSDVSDHRPLIVRLRWKKG